MTFQKKRYESIKDLYREILLKHPRATLEYDKIMVNKTAYGLYEGIVTEESGQVKRYYV